jgi:transcriptional regulator
VYVPVHFGEDDDGVVLRLLRAAGFGHLVVARDDGIESTPMPFVVDDELTSVRAHLARANPIWRAAPCDALLIVPISDAYVSPSWYASKLEHGRVVPTWNYEVVHVSGPVTAHDDDAWLAEQIDELTGRNEAALPAPWRVTDAPDDFVAKQRRAIVGIELHVREVQAKRKLSQNRDAADRSGAVAGLRSRGVRRSDAVADAME